MTIDNVRKLSRRHRAVIDIQIDNGDVTIKVSKPGKCDDVKILRNRYIETSPIDVVMLTLKKML